MVTAGTSDLAVAEEAMETLRALGAPCESIYDVGVAGLHRLLAYRDRLAACDIQIVVAGMEGALASVAAGITGKPTIAVPTSVGYGASFGGVAALLGMLNSCAVGVTVVNIDNGFGAAAAAALLLRQLRGVVAGRVRLGTSASISVYLLPLALQKFRARFPDIDLVVVTGLAPDIARGVVANDLDLGLVSLPVRDRQLAVTPFYRDRLVAIAPLEPRWRRRGAVRAAELADVPLILFDQGSTVRRMIDAWFHRARLVPRPAMELGNTEAMKRFVEAGMGLSIVSEFSVKADVASGRLLALPLDPPVMRQIGLVRRRDKPASPPLTAVLDALEDLRRRLVRR